MLYAVAGTSQATFHGDEAMQIAMSRDYWTGVIDGDFASLTTQPPYPIDSDAYLRLINGSVNRYLIGFAWQFAGYSRDQLPPSPGWQWALDYANNVQLGFRSANALLHVARLPSALLLALSIPILFILGSMGGGRVGAYLATALYTLSPVILLNGRRAMQEGSLLCFGLLALLLAAHIANRRVAAGHAPLSWWAALIGACALTFASKHSGIIFIGGAFGWIIAGELTHFHSRRVINLAFKTAVSVLIIIVLFIGLSPALWNDPPARIADLLDTRAQLLDMQVSVNGGEISVIDRIKAVFLQPYSVPAVHYEAEFWSDDQTIGREIDAYIGSGLAGVTLGLLSWIFIFVSIGGILFLIAALRRGTPASRAYAAGLCMTGLIVVISTMASPLAWQRYYLPLLPVVYLCAAYAPQAFLHSLDGEEVLTTAVPQKR